MFCYTPSDNAFQFSWAEWQNYDNIWVHSLLATMAITAHNGCEQIASQHGHMVPLASGPEARRVVPADGRAAPGAPLYQRCQPGIALSPRHSGSLSSAVHCSLFATSPFEYLPQDRAFGNLLIELLYIVKSSLVLSQLKRSNNEAQQQQL